MFNFKKKWEVNLNQGKVDEHKDWVNDYLATTEIWFTLHWNLSTWAYQLYEHWQGDERWIITAVNNFVDIGIASSNNQA